MKVIVETFWPIKFQQMFAIPAKEWEWEQQMFTIPAQEHRSRSDNFATPAEPWFLSSDALPISRLTLRGWFTHVSTRTVILFYYREVQ